MLLLAMGFTGVKADALFDGLDVAPLRRGALPTDAAGRLLGRGGPIEGVFVAGDAARGASLVVHAIAEGREVARSVDAFLSARTALPTRGVDLPFEGPARR